MIGLSNPLDPIDPAVRSARGGFAWWYLDLLDARGNGLVLIWSLNLPFLPEVSYGRRAGRPTVPAACPSLNVAVHKDGQPAFYLLQQQPEEAWQWSPEDGTWLIGDSRIRLDRRDDGSARLHATLDCAVPGTPDRLTGTVEVTGRLRQVGQTGDRRSPHLWCPLITATTGQAHLRWGDGQLDLEGRAYLDRNESPAAIQDLGIARWWWGRLPLRDRELIWYRLQPADRTAPARHIVVEVAADGASRRVEDHPIVLSKLRFGSYGLRYPRAMAFEDPDGRPVSVSVDHVVEDGPFYQRFVVNAAVDDEIVQGVAELVDPHRIALPGLRPLIEMRVHRAAGPNSLWLPLFTGGRTTRIGRLLGQLGGRPALPRPAASPPEAP